MLSLNLLGPLTATLDGQPLTLIEDAVPVTLGQDLPALIQAGHTSFKVFMTYAKLKWMTDDYWRARRGPVRGRSLARCWPTSTCMDSTAG